eukprot:14207320-Ditylum_brightwellii.AAC.1
MGRHVGRKSTQAVLDDKATRYDTTKQHIVHLQRARQMEEQSVALSNNVVMGERSNNSASVDERTDNEELYIEGKATHKAFKRKPIGTKQAQLQADSSARIRCGASGNLCIPFTCVGRGVVDGQHIDHATPMLSSWGAQHWKELNEAAACQLDAEE